MAHTTRASSYPQPDSLADDNLPPSRQGGSVQQIPDELRHGPFLAEHAVEFGLSQRALVGRRFQQLIPRVYATADQPVTAQLLARAALLVAPKGTIVTGVTALQMHGVDIGELRPVRLMTTHRHPVRRRDLQVTRVAELPPAERSVCLPAHALMWACRELDLLDAVTAGDELTRTRKPALLRSLARDCKGPGTRRVRRAVDLIRDQVDSPRETRLRMCLLLAGLPEPTANPAIGKEGSGCRDLVYRDYKLILEYEGDHHRVDRSQWIRDLRRHEGAAIEGWFVLRITSQRMDRPRSLVRSVHQRLVERGYLGSPPTFNEEWQDLFAPGR
jgi:hypothetical protein